MRGYGRSIRFRTLCGAQQGWETDLDRLSPFPPSVVAMRRQPSFLRGDVLRNKTGGELRVAARTTFSSVQGQPGLASVREPTRQTGELYPLAAVLRDFDDHQLTAIAEFLARTTSLGYRHVALLRAQTYRAANRAHGTAQALIANSAIEESGSAAFPGKRAHNEKRKARR